MTDITSPPRSPATRALTFLAHRWPTALGLLAMVFSVLDEDDGRGQAVIVFLAALIYLATAVVGRPGTVWILFGVSVVGVTVLRLFEAALWPALVACGVTALAMALVSDLPRRPRLDAVQIPAMLVFGAAAVLALSLSPTLGTLLVAAALIGHGTLDVIVWRARQVVARSLAEFCAALDLTLGLALIILTLT
ncbi:hypothetical protein SAMN05444920_1011003 [Nonomuraea solani]|uniref:Uncharacterized protein n=1 Tax=Nonomuraea solani TaxID=1144553 RepID=A0A1H5VXT0_9ACTN|nr:hypothetical protein [Nonomuraea solani]SEF91367.1 hypothetical protein SAMN05444920_1011003 [Nonomuraea solani]